MARRPPERERVSLDGGRRTTQLMRDSLGGSDLPMVRSPSPLEPIVAAMPSLAPWYAQFRRYPVDDVWSHLAAALVATAETRVIPGLRAIAPAIETALKDWDDHDQVSLGLIECLIWGAEEGQLDLERIRDDLGPLAKQTWNSLQAGLSPIYFDSHHIRDFCGAPARLDRCVPTPGAPLQPDALLARLTHAHRQYELRVLFQCYMGRYIIREGAELKEGDLILYVATPPDSDAHPERPFAQMIEIATNAAA